MFSTNVPFISLMNLSLVVALVFCSGPTLCEPRQQVYNTLRCPLHLLYHRSYTFSQLILYLVSVEKAAHKDFLLREGNEGSFFPPRCLFELKLIFNFACTLPLLF